VLLRFSTEPVENFVGKPPGARGNARPVLLRDSLPAFAAPGENQQNQQLT
jgi:hypothetical protein